MGMDFVSDGLALLLAPKVSLVIRICSLYMVFSPGLFPVSAPSWSS